MKLRLGQAIQAKDGTFGELGDIVVDPQKQTVTHLVVEPHHKHYQARLVPIELVSETDDGLLVDLDLVQLRKLDAVSFFDYIQLGEPIQVADNWDVGTEDLISLPYINVGETMYVAQAPAGVTYDRIPKGECEIRRQSDVVASDGHTVGQVHGFLADDDHLSAIAVRCGLPGFRYDVLVPFDSVAKVRSDCIDLTIEHEAFASLPRTEALGEADDLAAHFSHFQDQVRAAAVNISAQGRKLVSSAKSRFGKPPSEGSD